MKYTGRLISVAIVLLFNLMRYYYYHIYFANPFKASFFVLTAVFLAVVWIGGKQYDRAKYYAEKDPLTGAYNRRVVNELFVKQRAAAKRRNEKIGIALIDLDDFKEVNDQYGHQTGDDLLRSVADAMKLDGKAKDTVVRWGGDEFVHIIPNIDDDFRTNYIAKMKGNLSNLEMEAVPSIGASIGIAVYPDDAEHFMLLVQRADAMMYEMKEEKESRK